MKTILSRLGLLLCAGLLTLPAIGRETTPATTEAPPTSTEPEAAPAIVPEAMEILMRMAEHLARLQRLSVDFRAGYDVVQESGQKIEFGEQRSLLLRRPDGLRVETRSSDGGERLSLFDGRTITVLDVDENVYAKLEKPGDLDATMLYMVRDMGLRIPLAMLFVTTLPAELERRVQALAVVEEDRLTEVPTIHLAGRTEDVDFQIWIRREGDPLPHRVVITYKHAEGEPQFWAVFSKWNPSPEVSDAVFAFDPPQDAEQIPFLVRVPLTETTSGQMGETR